MERRSGGGMTTSRRFSCALFLAIAACSAAPTAQQRIESAELKKLAAVKVKYQGVIAGYDIHGPSIDVSLDEQTMIDRLDENSQAAMNDDVTAHWRSIWGATHPGKHAQLTVRFINFRGVLLAKEHATV
jgi:hypothetical protein